MIELLGLLTGGIFRLIPEFLKLFTAKRDADHEYRMTQLQLEIDKARATMALDAAAAHGAITANQTELQAWADVLANTSKPTGDKWVDRLSASVRPVLAYWHCLFMYTLVKVILVVAAFQEHAGLRDIAATLMTDWDRAVVASIFSFWYVDRSLRK